MKHLFILTVCAFVISSSGYAQNAIEHIRKKVQVINIYQNHQISEKDLAQVFPDYTSEGGYIKGFFRNGTLEKIVVVVNQSNGKLIEEYFMDNQRLVFVFTRQERYLYDAATDQWNYDQSTPVFEGRYYFQSEQLIKAVLDGEIDNYIQIGKELLQRKNQMKNAL